MQSPTDTINPALVARIRKLLNLSRDGAASENEQQQASDKAQALMMEHNISIATVEAASTTHTNIKRRKDTTAGYVSYDWQQSLIRQVATGNFCSVIITPDWNGRRWVYRGFDMIGREENVIAAVDLYDYLRKTTERLARDYTGDNKLSSRAHSFKEGCAGRVQQRLYANHRAALEAQAEAARAANAAANTGTALVPLMVDFAEVEECLNEDFRLGLEPGTTAHSRHVSSLRSKALRFADKALMDNEALRDVDDKDVLTQLTTGLAREYLSASMGGAELEDAVAYVIDYAVEWHRARVLAKKNPKAAEQARRAARRSWGRSSHRASNRDHAAYSAGEKAGASVGLDKQVNAGSGAPRLR